MSFDVDEDILQDFLVEAGEILEQLQEQLVDLENNPEDADLLNEFSVDITQLKGEQCSRLYRVSRNLSRCGKRL